MSRVLSPCPATCYKHLTIMILLNWHNLTQCAQSADRHYLILFTDMRPYNTNVYYICVHVISNHAYNSTLNTFTPIYSMPGLWECMCADALSCHTSKTRKFQRVTFLFQWSLAQSRLRSLRLLSQYCSTNSSVRIWPQLSTKFHFVAWLSHWHSVYYTHGWFINTGWWG